MRWREGEGRRRWRAGETDLETDLEARLASARVNVRRKSAPGYNRLALRRAVSRAMNQLLGKNKIRDAHPMLLGEGSWDRIRVASSRAR